jgi:hypothetical protein
MLAARIYNQQREVSGIQAKRVKDSLITIVYQMTHQDANLAGNVHGGVILRKL